MKLKTILSTALLAAVTASASALTWMDRLPESGNGPLDFLNEKYGRYDNSYDYSFSGVFNIIDAGFDPSMHVVNSIKVDFFFADDDPRTRYSRGDAGEKVDIYVGADSVNGEQKIGNNIEVDGSHYNAPYNYDKVSFDVTNTFGILDDMSNGYLRFRVKLDPYLSDYRNSREDTWLKIAKVTVEGSKVPDAGSTLTIFGIGLLSIVGLRRRFSK